MSLSDLLVRGDDQIIMNAFEGYRKGTLVLQPISSRGSIALIRLTECLGVQEVKRWAKRNERILFKGWENVLLNTVAYGPIRMPREEFDRIIYAVNQCDPRVVQDINSFDQNSEKHPLDYLFGMWVIADQMLIHKPHSKRLNANELEYWSELKQFLHKAICKKIGIKPEECTPPAPPKTKSFRSSLGCFSVKYSCLRISVEKGCV